MSVSREKLGRKHDGQDVEIAAGFGHLQHAAVERLFGKPPLFVSVEGEASLVHDKSQFAAHWKPELDRWFKDGIDTAGVTMIKVRAKRVRYWDGEDQGELVV